MVQVLAALVGFAAAVLILWFLVWLVILLPMRMARDRSRSALAWVLVSLVLSPLVAILGLALLGPAS